MLIPMRIGDRAKKVYKINARRSFIGFKKLGKRGEGIKIQSRGIESIITYIKPQNCKKTRTHQHTIPLHSPNVKRTDYRGSSFLDSGYRGLFTRYSNVIGLEIGFWFCGGKDIHKLDTFLTEKITSKSHKSINQERFFL